MTAGFVWTDAEVRVALGLRADLAEPQIVYTGVSTDSRSIAEGALYVALAGDRFDGHDFVADAMSRGAAGAVVSRQPSSSAGARLYPVGDTLVALGSLAAHRRRSLGVPVVAITGSSGKTTTKDLTAAALAADRRVHATRGNLNNRIGMPLTLLSTPDDVEAVVLELGSNEPGEIGILAQIARPDIGVITTVGESHLEKLGSLEGVLEEKLDLLRSVASGGRCVVGDDPEELVRHARGICPGVRVAGWTERADSGLRPAEADVDVFGCYRFRWKGQAVTLPLPGRHAVSDAMIALSVAELLGVSPAHAARGLESAETNPLRGEVRQIGDLTVIVDCYNANPQSVRAALDLLEGQGVAARRVAVLGTMLELGAESDRLHEETLADALSRDVQLVVATGGFSGAAMRLGRCDEDRVLCAGDWKEAYPRLRERLNGGEVVLLKASRGVALEGILPLLEGEG